MTGLLKTFLVFVAFLITFGFVVAYDTTETSAIGAPGVAMQITESTTRLEDKLEDNEVPPPLPPARPGGALAAEEYENVHVLGHLSTAQFTRLMTAITLWVAPEQGCAYCHNTNNLASDELYTKRVSRRMLQMTQHINENWGQHVAQTGVTCYTCHRGQPVPEYVWFDAERGPDQMIGNREFQNVANPDVGLSSMPANAFETFLDGEVANIRVQSDHPLPTGNRRSIKQTEWTYGLMMHFSQSLGVNCTYCHNSRSWGDWEQSPEQRGTAWYGIRMVRDINQGYLQSIAGTLPEGRLGPHGDVPKANCMTCHQGAYKPLLGHSMLEDYPSLAAYVEQPVIEDEPEEETTPEDEMGEMDGDFEAEAEDEPDVEPEAETAVRPTMAPAPTMAATPTMAPTMAATMAPTMAAAPTTEAAADGE